MNGQVIKHSTGGFKLLMIGAWILAWALRTYPIFLCAVGGFLLSRMFAFSTPVTPSQDTFSLAVGASVGMVFFVCNTVRMLRRRSQIKELFRRVDAMVAEMSETAVLEQIEKQSETNAHLQVTPRVSEEPLPEGLPETSRQLFSRFETVSVLSSQSQQAMLSYFLSRETIAENETGLWRVGYIGHGISIFVDGRTGEVDLRSDWQEAEPIEGAKPTPPPSLVSLPRFVLVYALSFQGAVANGGEEACLLRL